MLEGQKFDFLNMVMWHIKLMGMSLGYPEHFYRMINFLTLGWGQRANFFLEKVGICDGAPWNVF